MDETMGALTTEAVDDRFQQLDRLSTAELLAAINREDQTVAHAVKRALPAIAGVVEAVVARLGEGGRMLYVGAGTSGRIAVLDAAEWTPTFGTPDGLVVGVLAGGLEVFLRARENAEDDEAKGAGDLARHEPCAADVVLGVTASGRTPYVQGALRLAAARGALTVLLSNNVGSRIGPLCDHVIEVDTGPEVLAGSTRLKAGTAQKMVLNMISTAVMVKAGRVYRNLMVDVRPTNAKLVERARRIIALAADVSPEEADRVWAHCHQSVKAGIVMARLGIPYEEAARRLAGAGGFVRRALEADAP